MSEELSYGGKIAGVEFNPSGDDVVARIKADSANNIDFLNDLRQKASSGEAKRMYSDAISDLQKAQMMAVKAATWRYE